jgi:hypothetical protein
MLSFVKEESDSRAKRVLEAETKIRELEEKLARAEAVCEELKGSTPPDIVGNEGARLLEVWRKGNITDRDRQVLEGEPS